MPCHRLIAVTIAFAAIWQAPYALAVTGQLGSQLFVPTDIYNAAGSNAGSSGTAGDLFEDARDAVAAGQVANAFQSACFALSSDPNHADARRLLGYRRVGEHWAGGYAQRMLEGGNVWSPEFGWVKTEDLPKYESGLRPSRGRWISPEEDARQHARIERGWTVRTDHVLVTTNIDRAAGVELATRLETLYQLWRQLFGEFAATPKELQSRLAGKETAGFMPKPFRVRYYRNRDEYIAALAPRQPGIEASLGVYFDADRMSHFFAGPEQDPGTIAHEAVHQFFYESAPRATRHLAATANVWAVEGVACYFESLTPAGPPEAPSRTSFLIGDPSAGRLQAARHRRVVDNYYVPLAELCALGLADLQERPDLPRLYSQSAGLASFFIDGAEGRYRGAFRELLAAIYAGRDAPDTLAKAAGVPYEQLDREYLDYMKSLPVTAAIAP